MAYLDVGDFLEWCEIDEDKVSDQLWNDIQEYLEEVEQQCVCDESDQLFEQVKERFKRVLLR